MLGRHSSLAFCFVAALLLVPVVLLGQTVPPPCVVHPAGQSNYLICVPPGFEGADLVVFAHGYVNPLAPAGQIPMEQLTLAGQFIPAFVNQMGFAFATSSFPKNGLAITEGIADLEALLGYYKTLYAPQRVYLVGVSEGGLIAVKLIEQVSSGFDGGLALCAPIGDFRAQINHIGDFRVIFDYFFPDLLPPDAVDIPVSLIEGWDSYAGSAAGAMQGNTSATGQLFSVTKIPSPPEEVVNTALGLLAYNVFATNDATMELGGQPFGNRARWYFGSSNDRLLNRNVERYSADPAALLEIQRYYQTSGKLKAPLVTMHTTGDPLIPYWHEPLYWWKVLLAGKANRYVHVPVVGYGHCSFDPAEVAFGFQLLVQRVTGQSLTTATAVLPTEESRQKFQALIREHGK